MTSLINVIYHLLDFVAGVVTYKCLKKLLAENDVQLFDVRTRQEVTTGKVPGATNTA